MASEEIELWRIETVQAKTGLSRTQLYRRARDTDPATNPFPKARTYRSGRASFWPSDEVRAWVRRELEPLEAMLG